MSKRSLTTVCLVPIEVETLAKSNQLRLTLHTSCDCNLSPSEALALADDLRNAVVALREERGEKS